jgi:DNA polymerase/3'-5' exonuclease PolX
MPYIATRRLYNIAGRKASKGSMYRKAKRLLSEITKDLSTLEYRVNKSKG